jgi:hypothetical protein
VGVLKSLKEEVKGSKLVSAGLVRETENLIKKLEAEIA